MKYFRRFRPARRKLVDGARLLLRRLPSSPNRRVVDQGFEAQGTRLVLPARPPWAREPLPLGAWDPRSAPRVSRREGGRRAELGHCPRGAFRCGFSVSKRPGDELTLAGAGGSKLLAGVGGSGRPSAWRDTRRALAAAREGQRAAAASRNRAGRALLRGQGHSLRRQGVLKA